MYMYIQNTCTCTYCTCRYMYMGTCTCTSKIQISPFLGEWSHIVTQTWYTWIKVLWQTDCSVNSHLQLCHFSGPSSRNEEGCRPFSCTLVLFLNQLWRWIHSPSFFQPWTRPCYVAHVLKILPRKAPFWSKLINLLTSLWRHPKCFWILVTPILV